MPGNFIGTQREKEGNQIAAVVWMKVGDKNEADFTDGNSGMEEKASDRTGSKIDNDIFPPIPDQIARSRAIPLGNSGAGADNS